jgi:hypothetical protein
LYHEHNIYAINNHKHEIDDITDLSLVLDQKAPLSHNHDKRYARIKHNHDRRYALVDHEHEFIEHEHGEYALLEEFEDFKDRLNDYEHNFDVHGHGEYACADHDHEEYAYEDHGHEEYALADHEHEFIEHDHEEYALADHGHELIEHSHNQYALTNHSHELIEHEHSISDIIDLQYELDGKASIDDITSHLTTNNITIQNNGNMFFRPTVSSGNFGMNWIYGTSTTQLARITVNGPWTTGRFFEIGVPTGGNANPPPIHVRQYTSNYGGITRTLTLLDASGNTTIPVSLTVAGRNILNELDNRSLVNHSHELIEHTHNQYALTSHNHTIANITNLQTELNNKSNTNHSHNINEIVGQNNIDLTKGNILFTQNSTINNFGGIGFLPNGTQNILFYNTNTANSRISAGQAQANNGYLEISTSGNNVASMRPIWIRQFSQGFGTIVRQMALLDEIGNTVCPGSIIVSGNNSEISNHLRIHNKGAGHSTQYISTEDNDVTSQSMQYFGHSSNRTARVGCVGPYGAIRPLEISVGYGNNMGIVARQYTGNNVWSTIRNELTILDAAGNTHVPNNLTVNGNINCNSLNTMIRNEMISLANVMSPVGSIVMIRGGGANSLNSQGTNNLIDGMRSYQQTWIRQSDNQNISIGGVSVQIVERIS